MLIYGDLDISILDELPPGRTPVKTRCITGKRRQDLYRFLDSEIDKGRQVYLVCPAIEDVPDGGLNAVKTYYEDIAKALLPDRRVGLMHGKLKPKEKAAVMEDFKAGRLDALVSTTVIEVGVDVPNASVMVIENAERYGLSALHQLRGRVGRGAAESWCFLVSDNTSEAVQKRLKFLCSTTDGFAVAQYDLETPRPRRLFRQPSARPAHLTDRRFDERHPHPARRPERSRRPACRRPAAGKPCARFAGCAGAADVRQGRADELRTILSALCFAQLQRKNLFIVRVCRGLRAATYASFTGGAVTATGICHCDFTHKKAGQKRSGF